MVLIPWSHTSSSIGRMHEGCGSWVANALVGFPRLTQLLRISNPILYLDTIHTDQELARPSIFSSFTYPQSNRWVATFETVPSRRCP
jgi:hypothetical protein